jgi:hypothetical protein
MVQKTNLLSVTLGSLVVVLGDNCFNGCTALTSIIIPSSVTSIGVNCFYNSSKLTSITHENPLHP